MEKQEEPEQMKFGILNVQPGQTKEGSMFMNSTFLVSFLLSHLYF